MGDYGRVDSHNLKRQHYVPQHRENEASCTRLNGRDETRDCQKPLMCSLPGDFARSIPGFIIGQNYLDGDGISRRGVKVVLQALDPSFPPRPPDPGPLAIC
jgi:hypothetical protein